MVAVAAGGEAGPLLVVQQQAGATAATAAGGDVEGPHLAASQACVSQACELQLLLGDDDDEEEGGGNKMSLAHEDGEELGGE